MFTELIPKHYSTQNVGVFHNKWFDNDCKDSKRTVSTLASKMKIV